MWGMLGATLMLALVGYWLFEHQPKPKVEQEPQSSQKCESFDFIYGDQPNGPGWHYKLDCDLAKGHEGYHQYTFQWSHTSTQPP